MTTTTLTVQDHTLGGQILHELFLKFQSQRISVAELIEQRVRAEVAEYNQRADAFLLRRNLVVPGDTEQLLNAKSPKAKRQINADKQVAAALQAFKQNGFFVLLDNRQLENLDDIITLNDGMIVSFIKLTPLVGG
ncbi:hypothetical protein [Conchiformibius kuhniae]|uniref:Uncharacterized protein n=1 Tax=Conchiformibius kuhniae TaxID=211502 RepID=A0A8T9MZH2_9NEIS|nr:hypothetical protein [Conchiformibius kuhniae]UOP05602.1 hypothetical protein LVJ77_05795 [Conchiformibius kuhniae]